MYVSEYLRIGIEDARMGP